MAKKIVRPQKMSPPGGNYSHGIVVSPRRLLFIAGQTAVDPGGNIVGVGDAHIQAKQVYENIETVLSDAGMRFSDLVKITTYITDVSYRESVNKVRSQYIQKDFPASTLVVVKGLARKEFLVEVEAIACADD